VKTTALFVILLILGFCTGAYADDLLTLEQIADKSKAIQGGEGEYKSLNDLLPDSIRTPTDRQNKTAAELLTMSQKILHATFAEEAERLDIDKVLSDSHDPIITVFITLGKAPEYNQGKKLLHALVGVSGVQIVINGLPDGVRHIDTAARVIQQLAGSDFSQIPPVMIDPVRFQKYAVTQSPTLIYEKEGKEVARVSGQLSYRYLRKKVEKDDFKGNLGVLGTTSNIVERDFIEEIKDRMSRIDWVAKQENAKKRFWKKQKLEKLAAASEDRTFTVTPEFVVTQNIMDHKGNIVVKAGEKINVLKESLKHNPTPFYLIIFDGSDPTQVEQAKVLSDNAPANHKKILITTTLSDLEHGWESLDSLQNQLGAAVFILDQRFIETFDLQYVPCTVRPDKTTYVIQEYRREL